MHPYLLPLLSTSNAALVCVLQAALQELEELKQIVPKESLVYFLIGKVRILVYIYIYSILARTKNGITFCTMVCRK